MLKSPRAVIDQPGLKIILSGLILALFMGLGLKSQITTQKVSQTVRQSLQNLNLGLDVDFDNAEVKLSDWGIPKPYVVINQLRLKNSGDGCGQSQIYIEKLILPLSVDLIFNPREAVISLRLNRVEARIGSQTGCPSSSLAQPADTGPATSTSSVVSSNSTGDGAKEQLARVNEVKSMLKNIRSKISTQLSLVRIDLFKVIYENGPQKNFELRNAIVQFEYSQSQLVRVVLQSQVVGIYDTHSNSFKLRSDVSSEFNISDAGLKAQLAMKGKIIDREFSADAVADTETGLIKISSYLKNMPLKTLIELGRPSLPVSPGSDANSVKDSTGYQVSLDYSLNFNLTGEVAAKFDFYKLKWLQASLDNTVIKSPDSSIELNHFDYLRWISDEKYKVQLVVVQFDLNNFYRLFGLSNTKKTLDNLGVFSGTLEIAKNYEAVLAGILRNTTVIFSTQNKVRFQKITSMNLKSILSKNIFQLKLSDISIENQKILGQIEVKVPFNVEEKRLELEPKNLVFNASLKGKILTPEIEQHMFAHEQDYDLNLKLINTGSGRQILLTAEEFKFSNLNFKKINFFIDLDADYKPLGYRLSARTLAFNESQDEGSENDYIKMMETYLKEQQTSWPVVVQNFEMKYNLGSNVVISALKTSVSAEPLFFDQFSMTINAFSSPKNFLQFKQIGKLNSTSVWQIENVLKTTERPATTSQFFLNPSQGTFEKVE